MQNWELIQAFVDHSDHSAFGELVDRHAALVYSAAIRRLDNEELAKDVAQRTFLLLARKAASFSPKISLASWLYITACNFARDAAKAERRRAFYETRSSTMNDPVAPAATSGWDEIAPLLDDAIAALADSDRLAIVTRYLQEKPISDVASILGTTEAAAKMRLARALEKLRDQFQRRGVQVSGVTLGVLLLEHSVQAIPPQVMSILRSSATIGSPTTLSPVAVSGVRSLFKWGQTVVLPSAALVLVGLVAFKMFPPANLQHGTSSASTNFARTNNTVPLQQIQRPVPDRASPESDALHNLKIALTDPWGSRTAPLSRVEAALKAFGSAPQLALPVLMGELNRPRSDRSFDSFVLAAHGLAFLGTNASSALPQLVVIARGGDLAILNDQIPKLFRALSPNGAVVPELIDLIKAPLPGSDFFALAIAGLIRANPHLETASASQLRSMLNHEIRDTRILAACVLARLPTKQQEAIPVLVDALRLDRLRDPNAYAPLVIREQNTTVIRTGEQAADGYDRLRAIQALGELGSAGRAAVPALKEFARLTQTGDHVRNLAMLALAKIDSSTLTEFPDAASLIRSDLRARQLAEKAQQGTATLDELKEGLSNQRSVDASAAALKALGVNARRVLPELVNAIQQFGDYESTQRVKELASDTLIGQLTLKNTNGLVNIAEALGECGPSMARAVPHLEALLELLPSSHPAEIIAIGDAIEKIHPGHPKMVFTHDEISPAANALVQAIYDQKKIRSSVYDAYITDLQDHNTVSRPRLLKFIASAKADPALHAVFLQALLERNPALAVELKP